jgi:hypothetical protein
MNEPRFDALVRTMTTGVGRRAALRALVGAGLGLAVTGVGVDRLTGRLTGPPLAGATEQQAGSCYPAANALSVIPYGGRFAETFVASTTGKLSRVQFVVDKPANSKGDYLVQLLTVDANGIPTNKVLAKATIRDGAVAVGNAVTVNAHFKKRKTVKLTAGTRYAVAVSRPLSAGIRINCATGDPCSTERMFKSTTPTAPFVEYTPGYDMLVAVFVGF